jgi:hypothetical protein
MKRSVDNRSLEEGPFISTYRRSRAAHDSKRVSQSTETAGPPCHGGATAAVREATAYFVRGSVSTSTARAAALLGCGMIAGEEG